MFILFSKAINRSVILRFLQLFLGGFILGLGSSLCFKAGWGAVPITVLFDGIVRALNTNIGNPSIIVSLVMITTAFFLDKKQLGIGTIISPFAIQFGLEFGMSFYKLSIDKVANIPFLVLGIIIIGFGASTSIKADVGKSAYDALLIGLTGKFKYQYHQFRWAIDALFIIIGCSLGGQLTLGTALSIIFLGKIITLFNKGYDKLADYLKKDNKSIESN